MGNGKFKLLKSEKIATSSTSQGKLQTFFNSRNMLETVDNSLLHRQMSQKPENMSEPGKCFPHYQQQIGVL